MPCFHPIKGWKARDGTFTTNSKKTWIDKREEMVIPCGQCLGCRLEYSRQWASRCVLEARLHKENSFITLTYDDEHLPKKGVLKSDLQLFFKNLRRQIEYHNLPCSDTGVRYFACGEYGSKTYRPHYHAILFGFRPHDLILYSSNKDRDLFISPFLSKVWNRGHVIVGESVTFESCAYVARYCMKKFEMEEKNVKFFEVFNKNFILSSRRPAIGYKFFENNLREIKRLDKVLIREGIRTNPPRYFDKKLKDMDLSAYNKMKEKRKSLIADLSDSVFYRKLENKEVITSTKIKQTKGDVL